MLAGDRLGREVGRFIDSHDDVGKNSGRRAEVTHLCGDATVARIGVLDVHRRAERRGRAPVAVRDSVNGRDAPEVVGAIIKLRTHVEVGLELATFRRGERHEVRGGVDDVAEGFVLRHFEHERGGTFGRLPHERGTCGLDHVAVVTGCAGRRGRDELRRERAREGVDRLRIAPIEIDRVADGADVLRRNTGCERVGYEIRLVEVVLAVLDEIGLGERLAAAEVKRLRIDRARFLERRAVDGGALDAHPRGGVGLRRYVKRNRIGAKRNFNINAVEADIHIPREALHRAALHDKRVEALLQARSRERDVHDAVNDLAGRLKLRIIREELLVGVRLDHDVRSIRIDSAYADVDVRQRPSTVVLRLLNLVPDYFARSVINRITISRRKIYLFTIRVIVSCRHKPCG